MKKNKTLNDLSKNVPLNIKIKVMNRMAFINLLSKLGYRENKRWGDDESERLNMLYNLSDELSEDILKLVKHENGKI